MRSLPGRLVLLGRPVEHSLSPAFQNAALRHLDIPLVYEAVDVATELLGPTLAELQAVRGAGNVTVPHKEATALRCDDLTPLARRVGAVNTFFVDSAGRLVGDNTDLGGFEHMAASVLGASRSGLVVAVLGAGGAAAAVLAAVEGWPGASVVLYNRSPLRARILAERFPVVARVTTEAADAVRGADVVVNASPRGMAGDELPVAVEALPPAAAVLDLVYRRGETPWVNAARAAGHPAADGLTMLLEQGALAFERWFGVPAPRDVMRAAVE